MEGFEVVFLILQFIITSAVAVWTLREFISFKRTIWYASFFSCVGWGLCYSIVLMIPVDIIDYDKSENRDNPDYSAPFTSLPGPVISAEWNILYWGTFFLSWFIFPFLQSYWLAGDFTKFEKFFSSFKENIYIYVIMGVVGGSGLTFLAIKDDLTAADVRQLTVLLANIYGLVIVVLLMGFGLVDIPRYLLKKANRSEWLKHYMIQAAVYKKEMEVTKEKMDDTIHKIRIVAQKIGPENQLRPFVEAILDKCPLEYRDSSGSVRRFATELDKEKVTYSQLVSLHVKVMNSDHAYTRASRLYEQIVTKALNLEDVLHSRNNLDWRVDWHFKVHKSSPFQAKLEWLWQVHLYTWFFRLLGFLCASLSLILVWCEVSMPFDNPDLSPLYLIIVRIPLHGFVKQVYCIIILAYMAVCTYTSLFKLQIWDYYRLVPHQQSDANSIMFSANYLCRLAAPLAFNFLLLTHQNAPAFKEVMGTMDGYFSLGQQFIFMFPVFVALCCLCTLFNVWERIARSAFMKHIFTSCWPIKKLKIHIDDPRALLEDGSVILRREREVREENNTGVSFDSVGNVSDQQKSRYPNSPVSSARPSTIPSPQLKAAAHPINKPLSSSSSSLSSSNSSFSSSFTSPSSSTPSRFNNSNSNSSQQDREREQREQRDRDNRALLREKVSNMGNVSRPSFSSFSSFKGGRDNKKYTALRNDIP